jgi:hypothetical protein
METLITVLSTIGVGALSFAVSRVIRLARQVNELKAHQENSDMALENSSRDFFGSLDGLTSSIDRRFDKVWADVHNLNSKKSK